MALKSALHPSPHLPDTPAVSALLSSESSEGKSPVTVPIRRSIIPEGIPEGRMEGKMSVRSNGRVRLPKGGRVKLSKGGRVRGGRVKLSRGGSVMLLRSIGGMVTFSKMSGGNVMLKGRVGKVTFSGIVGRVIVEGRVGRVMFVGKVKFSGMVGIGGNVCPSGRVGVVMDGRVPGSVGIVKSSGRVGRVKFSGRVGSVRPPGRVNGVASVVAESPLSSLCLLFRSAARNFVTSERAPSPATAGRLEIGTVFRVAAALHSRITERKSVAFSLFFSPNSMRAHACALIFISYTAVP